MLVGLTIITLTADIGLTWYLLAKYRGCVREGNALARWMFKGDLIGNMIFVAARIAIAALVIEFMTWAEMTAYIAVTGYAVVKNILVLRRLQ